MQFKVGQTIEVVDNNSMCALIGATSNPNLYVANSFYSTLCSKVDRKNNMATKKYPVGTTIKYVGYCKKCKGEVGKIVGVWKDGCYVILPQSPCSAAGLEKRFTCMWSDIEPVVKKNQQLVFSFME